LQYSGYVANPSKLHDTGVRHCCKYKLGSSLL
jgi:hypothetical protein